MADAADRLRMTQTLSLRDWVVLSECAKWVGKDTMFPAEQREQARLIGHILENEVDKEIARLKKKAGIES